jgi:hypothetical protein
MEAKHINENKVCFQNGNVLACLEFKIVILVCYTQQTLVLKRKISTP